MWWTEKRPRATVVGDIYLIRSPSYTPAAVIGGLLWTHIPQTPFLTAGATGIIGTVVFALTVEKEYAG